MRIWGSKHKVSLLAALAVIIALSAVIIAGGCGGSGGGSDNPADSKAKLYMIGDIDAATVASLNKAKIETVQFDPSMTDKVTSGSSFVMQEQGMQLVSADEDGKDLPGMLNRCFSTGGEIVLLSSDKSERDYLLDTVLADYAIEDDSDGVLKIFAVTNEVSGDTRVFISTGESGVVSSDTDEHFNAVLSGDQFYLYSYKDDNTAPISDNIKNIQFVTQTASVDYYVQDASGDIIKQTRPGYSYYLVASGDTRLVSCDTVESEDVTYYIDGDGITSYDNTEYEGEEPDIIPEDSGDDELWEFLQEWLSYEEDEANVEQKARMLASAKAEMGGSVADTKAANTKDLIKCKIYTFAGGVAQKPYTINVYIMPLHNFKDNRDWYVIRQECTVNAGHNYEYISANKNEYYKKIYNYIISFAIENTLLLGSGSTSDGVVLTNASPQTINKQVMHEETQGYKIGGGIGYTRNKDSQNEFSAKLAGSYEHSEKRHWSVKDVSCVYRAKDPKLTPSWQYYFNNQPKVKGKKIKNVDEKDLSRSTLTFENFWVWGWPTPEFPAKLDINPLPEIGSIRIGRDSKTPEILKSGHYCRYIETPCITLDIPPLFALEEHVIALDGTKGTKTTNVMFAVQGTAAISNISAPDWCYAEMVGNSIQIMAKSDNTTGFARSATITLLRNGSNEKSNKQIISVTQHPTF